jgi:hypothetical protein
MNTLDECTWNGAWNVTCLWKLSTLQGGPTFWECMNHVLDLNAGMRLESVLNCLPFIMKVQMLHMHKSRNWEFTIAVNLAS